jgi:hypothetical protein
VRGVVAALGSIIVLSACASTVTSEGGELKLDITVSGERPKAPLSGPRIVVYDAPVELLGDELTSEARARFERERAERISQRAQQARARNYKPFPARQIPDLLLECTLRTGPLCPGVLIIGLPVAAFVNVTMAESARGVTYVSASVQEPSLKLSNDDAARLGAMFAKFATGRELAGRVARFATPPESGEEQDRVSLLVRMRSIEIREVDSRLGVRLVVEAAAIDHEGVLTAATEHVCVYVPPYAWTSGSEETVRSVLGYALASVTENIATTYGFF